MGPKVFLVFGNLGAVTHAQDGLELIRKSLFAIGVDALYTADPVPNFINIFMEYFDELHLKKYLDVKKCHPKTKYIVIATEFVTGHTFNDVGMPDSKDHYSNREYWKNRFDNFMEFTTYCNDIWQFISPPYDIYKDLFKNTNIKVSYFPHCSIGPESFSALDWVEKDIDVFFSGSLTSYREKIIKDLQDDGFNVVCRLPGRTPNFVRESYVRRAKVCLALKLDEHSLYSSAGRIHYYLMRGIRHISEETPLFMDIDRYVCRFRKSDLLDMVRTCVKDADSFMPNFKAFHVEMAAGKVMNEIADSSAFHEFKLPLAEKTLST